MEAIIIIIAAGVLATMAMCTLLELITLSRLANADMVRAVGSLFTRSYEGSLVPGLIIQFSFGIVFAFLYFVSLSLLSFNRALWGIVGGVIIGFFHGMSVSLALVISVAEHHPLERFRKAGITVAVSHLAGHMVYGLIVGAIWGITGIRLFPNILN